MARRRLFTVRGSRRFKQRNNGSRKIWTYFLVAALLLFGLRLFNQKQPTPAAAINEAAVSQTGPKSFMDVLYAEIVSFVIPGVGEVSALPVSGSEGAQREKSVLRLALSDLRDPKQIIFAQLPFLGDPSVVPEPIVDVPDNTPVPPPKIIIPVQRELNGEGKIVIYHTHTTESFVPTSNEVFTDDLSVTVAALGEELAELLEEHYQIPVVHNSAIHDIPRDPAYQKARPTLEKLLTDNPDTVLVVDLHRDGIDDRGIVTGTIDGQSAARIMFVVGQRYEGWEANWQKAQFLHEALEEIEPGISRGIREHPLSVHNQDLHPGSLLIEVGSHKTSLEEARRTLPVLAQALAQLYNSGR